MIRRRNALELAARAQGTSMLLKQAAIGAVLGSGHWEAVRDHAEILEKDARVLGALARERISRVANEGDSRLVKHRKPK